MPCALISLIFEFARRAVVGDSGCTGRDLPGLERDGCEQAPDEGVRSMT